MPDRSPRWYTVPAGTPPGRCVGPTCGRTDIYWIETTYGRRVPVDCKVEGGHAPTEKFDPAQQDFFAPRSVHRDGRGVSHFDTCSDAEYFRGPRRGR